MSLRPYSAIGPSDIERSFDLRGWRVLARDGTRLGTVAELIVDVEVGSPVYIDIVPEGDVARSEQECWVRVPFHHTSIDDGARRVVLSDIAVLGLGTATAGLRVVSDGGR